MGKAKFSGYTRRNKREKEGVAFVMTYHPSLKNVGMIINQTYVFYIWMKKLKAYLRRLQWLLSVVQENQVVFKSGQNFNL